MFFNLISLAIFALTFFGRGVMLPHEFFVHEKQNNIIVIAYKFLYRYIIYRLFTYRFPTLYFTNKSYNSTIFHMHIIFQDAVYFTKNVIFYIYYKMSLHFLQFVCDCFRKHLIFFKNLLGRSSLFTFTLTFSILTSKLKNINQQIEFRVKISFGMCVKKCK